MDDLRLLLTLDHTAVVRQIFLWSALVVVVPLGVVLARMWRGVFYGLFFLMIWSICEPDAFGLNFFANPLYRAAVRGIEIYLCDLCAIILGITMWMDRGERSMQWMTPMLIPYGLYVLVGFISWTLAPHSLPVPEARRLEHMTIEPPMIEYFATGLYPLFELMRVVRCVLLMWVTANVVRDRRSWSVLMWAAAASLAYLLYAGVKERYLLGEYRVSAGLMHPNDYGAFVAMTGSLLLPFVFQSKRVGFSLSFMILVIGGVGGEIISVSRSGLFVYGLAMIVTAVYAFRYHWRQRNITYLVLGVAGCLVLGFLGRDTLTDRFSRFTVEDSIDERLLMNRQGVAMAQEHLFGVGLGNFSANSWVRYADLVDDSNRLEAGVPAHNIWYLTLGELGFPGLIVFTIIWLRAIQLIWRTWRSEISGVARALLLGATLCILMAHLESLVHFSFRNVAVYALCHVALGAVIGLYTLACEQQGVRAIRPLLRFV